MVGSSAETAHIRDRPGQNGGPDGARVVVIIPAWKAVATIGRAVSSALGQTELCHVVVIDDCSPDETIAAARAADDGSGRLTVLSQPVNGGPAAARNRGIAASTAPWIALLDADDIMEPGRIAGLLGLATGEAAGETTWETAPQETQQKAHQETPQDSTQKTAWDMVADDLYKVHESAVDGPRQRLLEQDDFAPHSLDFQSFVLGNIHGSRGSRGELGFLKPLMRRAFLEDSDIRYKETMRLGEDYDLYARALAKGARFRVVNPLGYVAVERAGSLSGRHGAADIGGIVAADRALLGRNGLAPADRQAVRRHLSQVSKEWAWLRLIDAVKARAPLQALACFAAPPPVIGALLARLGEQVVVRSRRRLFGGDGA